MHDEQYDFQMFTCNACQISAGKQNKPLKVAVCSLEEPHVVTSEPQYQLFSVHDESSGICAIFCPLFPGIWLQ